MTLASSRFATAASAGCDSTMRAAPNGPASEAAAGTSAAFPVPPSTGVKVLGRTSTIAGCSASSVGSLTVITVPCRVACSVRTPAILDAHRADRPEGRQPEQPDQGSGEVSTVRGRRCEEHLRAEVTNGSCGRCGVRYGRRGIVAQDDGAGRPGSTQCRRLGRTRAVGKGHRLALALTRQLGRSSGQLERRVGRRPPAEFGEKGDLVAHQISFLAASQSAIRVTASSALTFSTRSVGGFASGLRVSTTRVSAAP